MAMAWYFPASKILVARSPSGPEHDVYQPDEIYAGGKPLDAEVLMENPDGTVALKIKNPKDDKGNPWIRRDVPPSPVTEGGHYFKPVGQM